MAEKNPAVDRAQTRSRKKLKAMFIVPNAARAHMAGIASAVPVVHVSDSRKSRKTKTNFMIPQVVDNLRDFCIKKVRRVLLCLSLEFCVENHYCKCRGIVA